MSFGFSKAEAAELERIAAERGATPLPRPVRPSPELSKALGILLNQKPAKVKDNPRSVAQVSGNAPCQSLWIPNWTPALLNQIMRGHWSNGGRLKKADKDIVAFYFARSGITKATGPRRVSMVFILPKGKRMFDRDAPWKSAKDALAACGALLDDTPRLCIDGPVSYARAIGAESAVGTLILLEDCDG